MIQKNLLILLLALLLCSCNTEDDSVSGIILDTDISSDSDDVGAIAVLHALAESRQTDILAMMISSGDPCSPRALATLNRFFSRPETPIGVVSGESITHESSYTCALGEMLPDATDSSQQSDDLYRKVLAGQPDNSVTIVTIGYLTNLRNLLKSEGDTYSPLSGIDLVKAKVRLLVCMGGSYPEGKEWNFFQDAISTKYVIDNWPTRVVFAGYELGLQVVTGQILENEQKSSPVRLAYQKHNDFQGRPSWDQVAVLYAASGEDKRKQLFILSAPGVNTVKKDGSNDWNDDPDGNHFYLSLNKDAREVSRIIDSMMTSR